ncbi:MAG: thiamine phosphate synthase [Actinomycetota bacterium]
MRPEIHLITDRKQSRLPLARAIEAALKGGIDRVQLREKTAAPALALYELALKTIPLAGRERVIVNDRVDVALAVEAGGVHLAGRSLPPLAVRPLIGDRLLGVSVHGLDEARVAAESGADYVTFGHVYPTASKPGLPPRGLRELERIVEAVDVPVLAVGGIDPSNAPEVLATGASGVAVISSVLASPDPESAARALRRATEDHRPRVPFVTRKKGERCT